MALSDQEIDDLQKLAAIQLDPDERALLRDRLSRVLGYVEQLSAVDTEGVEPTSYPIAQPLSLRADENAPCLSAEQALANAPAKSEGHFLVPAVMGNSEESGG